MKGQAAPNYRKRKSKKVESNLNLSTQALYAHMNNKKIKIKKK
jgi:hypothetical protein